MLILHFLMIFLLDIFQEVSLYYEIPFFYLCARPGSQQTVWSSSSFAHAKLLTHQVEGICL